MNILPLVKTDYITLDAYESVQSARKILPDQMAIVVTLNGTFRGILVPEDLVRNRHQLIIDCLSLKPAVDSRDNPATVIDLMKHGRWSALPVFLAGDFMGVITLQALLNSYHAKDQQQETALLSAAHDLKSPVSTVRMLGNLLKTTNDARLREDLLAQLFQVCDHAQTLIEHILSTDEMLATSPRPAPADLNLLVEKSVRSLSTQIKGKDIHICRRLDCTATVSADHCKMERVITNLLSNSIKFTRTGGKITIATADQDSGQVLLSVEDTGIGIPPAIQTSIFDRFTKAKRAGTAGEIPSGLGLHFSKLIIEQHGGTISVESDGENGTCFTILLPAAPVR